MPLLPALPLPPQLLVSEYGSAADKVLFELLLRALSSKRNAGAAAGGGTTAAGDATPSQWATGDNGGGGGKGSPSTFFWVPPSQSLRLRTCSNPCCMNLSVSAAAGRGSSFRNPKWGSQSLSQFQATGGWPGVFGQGCDG